ncbi:MAG TPA: flagellar export chaperone FliS [Chthonomonas sp.]|uniref:flagellar export chaperone FliS n=1 Tax=Chthonomonas sp. TaxID=2282153 RepID=UPI002B4B606F|nr:flagellar export chaperone FliS [Chthonomonas sp.]HLI47937.1 flagellar export chaperone FliS [Chthonomonas sp.]
MNSRRSDASQNLLLATPSAKTQGSSTPHASLKNRNHRYRKTQIETASPAQLVLLLYEGAIRFCDQALEAMAQKNLTAQHANLVKAQEIIGELIGSLNQEAGGELAVNLRRIYLYMLEQLVLANLYDKQEGVQLVRDMLQSLHDAWAEAAQKLLEQTVLQTAESLPEATRLGDRHV